MIVLDTHVLLWLFSGDMRLGRQTRETIERERRESLIHVPSLVFWEIGMNIAKRRFILDRPLREWADFVLSTPNIRIAPFDAATAIDASQLADGLHGDPADRIIIATARALACPLATADERILVYADAGHVRAIDARR